MRRKTLYTAPHSTLHNMATNSWQPHVHSEQESVSRLTASVSIDYAIIQYLTYQ